LACRARISRSEVCLGEHHHDLSLVLAARMPIPCDGQGAFEGDYGRCRLPPESLHLAEGMVGQYSGEGAPGLLGDLESMMRVSEGGLLVALEARERGGERKRLSEYLEVLVGARELDGAIELSGRIVETPHRHEQKSPKHHEPDVGTDADDIDTRRQVRRALLESLLVVCERFEHASRFVVGGDQGDAKPELRCWIVGFVRKPNGLGGGFEAGSDRLWAERPSGSYSDVMGQGQEDREGAWVPGSACQCFALGAEVGGLLWRDAEGPAQADDPHARGETELDRL